ncbi:MAG: hypothetical protein B7Z73_09215 [Planctomycetia bacterium 21-64-5]|nr:MAG: hypothetical protein B7Z73_09215 [Planctomycetia bacterium 21-64-5]HQU45558.1 cyclic nucleotide-binding domain-containing protein [Pirellulales bacterium]
MPTPPLAETLAGVPLFAGFNPGDLDSLVKSFEEVSYPADGIVFRAGEQDPALYLIVSGAVEIVLDVPGGQEAVIATLEPKNVFGESSFFHPAPHSATARCPQASTLLRLSRREYERLLDAGSLAAFRLATAAAEILAARLQATDKWIADLLSEENQQLAASWRRFREQIGVSFDFPHGFVHPY